MLYTNTNNVLINEIIKKYLRTRNAYLNSSWLLWGGVGSEAGTSTVLGPWAIALASKSSCGLNGSWNPLDPKLLVTGKVKTQTPKYVQSNWWAGRTPQSDRHLTAHSGTHGLGILPSWLTNTPAFPASSSVVAKPFAIFWQAIGGGVGGREAGGVGGLLKLFCCRRPKNFKIICYRANMPWPC